LLGAAFPVGIISAIKQRSRFDRATMITTLALYSAPVPFLGLGLLYLFATDVGVIPIFPGIGAYTPISNGVGHWASALILPWIVLAAASAAIYARYLRYSLIERVLWFPKAYVDRSRSSNLHTQIVWDTERVDVMSNALVALVSAVPIAVGFCVVLLVLNPLLFADREGLYFSGIIDPQPVPFRECADLFYALVPAYPVGNAEMLVENDVVEDC